MKIRVHRRRKNAQTQYHCQGGWMFAGWYDFYRAESARQAALPDPSMTALIKELFPSLNMSLEEPLEPTGMTYLNDQGAVISVPLDSPAGEVVQADSQPDKFVVARLRDGEIVGEFDNQADAQALVDRARRQKKSALGIL
mgnify:CR=1 FL=1